MLCFAFKLARLFYFEHETLSGCLSKFFNKLAALLCPTKRRAIWVALLNFVETWNTFHEICNTSFFVLIEELSKLFFGLPTWSFLRNMSTVCFSVGEILKRNRNPSSCAFLSSLEDFSHSWKTGFLSKSISSLKKVKRDC